jgi:hypothetical protein
MDGYSRCWSDEKCMQMLVEDPKRQRQLEEIGVDGRILLK